jgi:hypothetical protein
MGFTKVVTTLEELKSAIQHMNTLKAGFNFDNSIAVTTLSNAIEEA